MAIKPKISATPSIKLQRSSGTVHVSFKTRDHNTVLDELYQQGCYKARFPHLEAGRAAEAILINTAGGLTDGDELSCVAKWQADTVAMVTTQAAERIYHSRAAPAKVKSELHIAERATACWLPQETILFDGARLERSTDIFLAPEARLLAGESLVFGRSATQEVIHTGHLFDRWRVCIGSKLVFNDAIQLADEHPGGISGQLAHRAIANRAAAMATLIYVGADSAQQLQNIRRVLADQDLVAGASNLGLVVVVRMLANSSIAVRQAIIAVFDAVSADMSTHGGNNIFTLPRVWSC